MESVAQAKLGAASGNGQVWQPGLLTVLLQGRLTDALGLGDLVAPSMLAGWARRFDLRLAAEAAEAAEGRIAGAGGSAVEGADAAAAGAGGYLTAAIGGYALGCVLLEVVPVELSRAALLFLVPSTAGAVVFRLIERKEIGKAFGGLGGSPPSASAGEE